MDEILNKIKKNHRFSRVMFMLAGCFLASIAYNFIFVPNDMIVGGVTGLAVIFKRVTGLGTTIFVDVLEVIYVIIGLIFLGKRGTLAHIVGALTYPFMITLTTPLMDKITIDFGSQFLNIFLGAVLFGIATGFVYRAGFSTGGNDIIIDIVSKKTKKTITSLGIIINGIIIFAGLFFFDTVVIMYSILILVVYNKVANVILFGVSSTKMVYVISKKNKHIAQYIMDEVHSGATEVNVKDGLFSKKKQMLICVVHNANYKEFKHRVLAMDPHAFMVSNNCYEAKGGVRFNLLPF